MKIFAFVFKVEPQKGYYPNVKYGYANVYLKAGSLIEGRLRAKILLQDAHWNVLEMRTDGIEHDPLLDDPHPIAADLLQKAKQDGVAILISGVAAGPTDGATLN